MASLFGGGDAGASEMRKATKLMEQNIARLEAIGIPSVEAQRIALESPELVGLLEAEQLGPSAIQGIQEDPRLKAAQLSALEEVSGLAQTGLGAEDRAAFNQLRRQASGMAQAQKATTLQQMQERGMGDSGASLIAQLQSGQAAADTAAQQGDRLAAEAAAARRQALGQQASMASQMSQQQLSLAGQKASAADAIAQFNAQNRQGVSAQNLASRQSIANQRAANRNQQEMYNKGLIQQQFQNEMAKASGVVGQQSNLAQQYGQQATAAQQAQQAMTSGLLQLAGTVGGAMVGGPAGAAVGSQVAGTVAPKPNTNYAVNWQPGRNTSGNVA